MDRLTERDSMGRARPKEKLEGQFLAQILERLAAYEEADWIPVTERLPERYEKVLTCDCKGNIHIMSHSPSFDKPFGIDRRNPRYYMVRYWHPLPTPPKKEK